jgi:cbb3-type cytochrome oxidase maturation protein
MLTITLCLFLAGIAMGAAFACIWAWGVRSGQFRDLEESKQQVFWPDIAPETGTPLTTEATPAKPKGNV